MENGRFEVITHSYLFFTLADIIDDFNSDQYYAFEILLAITS